MKKLLAVLIALTPFLDSIAQNQHDNNWVFAFRNLGGSILSFNNDSLQIETLSMSDANTYEALTSISDEKGDLIFYSNNCSVYSSNHELMENGFGLNPGQIQTYWCTVNPFANPNVNSVFSLPSPANDNIYYLFHLDYEVFNFGLPGGSQFAPLHFYRTTVDIDANNGAGKVISKNEILIEDTLSSCGTQAVRHANGRDWWIIVPEFKGNCYYLLLLSPAGIEIKDKQCTGHNWDKYARSGGAHFVKNGSKYIRSNAEYGLNIFDFDRCMGILSNPKHIDLEAPGTYLISSTTMSKSGRYAYYNTLKEIYQFDIDAPDIESSKTLVATYDGFQSAGNTTDFYHSELAPDGKIYICTYGPTYYLHVIEHPDSAKLACQVKQHNILLPNRHFAAMPNYPNYRLEALPGPCDTISVSIHEPLNNQNQIIVFPNPTSNTITIEHRGVLTITRTDILDLTGRVALTDTQQGNAITIHTKEGILKSGFYLLKITDERGRSEIKKIIIE